MTCHQFLERAYLREDELEPGELSELLRHRSTCAACASAYARIEEFRHITHELRDRQPAALSHPLLLTNAVMERIERDVNTRRAQTGASVIDHVVAWLSAPRVRVAMGAMLLLLTGSFAVEYVSAFVTMKGFEQTLNNNTTLQASASAAVLDQRNLLHAASELSNVLSGKQRFLEVSQNWVLIDRSKLQQLFLLYHDLHDLKENSALLSPEFRAANPRLSTLLQTEQQSAQLEMLLTERDSLIRELNSLLPKERKTP